VPANTPAALFTVYAIGGPPRFTIIRPDSSRVTPETAAANSITFSQNEDSNESFFYVMNPPAGSWQIEIEDGSAGPFVFDAVRMNAPPVLTDVQVSQSGGDVTVTYNASDLDDLAHVSLFYDNNDTDFDGTLIKAGLAESGTGSFTWHAGNGSVPSGDYFVYALVEDDANSAGQRYAPTKIHVIDPLAPVTPMNVVVQSGGENDLVISWAPNTEPDIRGYQVRYALDEGENTVLTETADAGNATSARLMKLAENKQYRVSVVAYDHTERTDPADPTKTITESRISAPSVPLVGRTQMAAPPVVELSFPASGDQIVNNDDVTISWTVGLGDDLIDQQVELSLDNGATYSPLFIHLSGTTRNVHWHVPVSVTSSAARMRVTATDRAGNIGVGGAATSFAILQSTDSSSVFGFGVQGISVAENGNSVEITVTRSGNTSSAASVNYATADGTASDRSDYTPAFGTVTFAAGEIQKTFRVLIINDSYGSPDDGVAETFSLVLSGGSAGTNISDTTVDVTIVDDDMTTASQNPLGGAQFFVRQHYLDFLSREPDASGLSFWANQISSCGTDVNCLEVKRINVSAAFYLSIEFQGTGFLVTRVHAATFGGELPTSLRMRDFLEETQSIGRGVVVGQSGWEQTLETNRMTFLNAWVSSQAFLTAFGGRTNEDYVSTLFTNGGVAANEEVPLRNSLINGLNSGTETRATALRQIVDSHAFTQQTFNPSFVLMQYYGYLRRNPNDSPDSDLAGYNFWLNKLNQFSGNFQNAEMVKAFINSGEYRGRFGK